MNTGSLGSSRRAVPAVQALSLYLTDIDIPSTRPKPTRFPFESAVFNKYNVIQRYWTPDGSCGTNGYVTKSKAFLRVREGPPGGQFGFKDFAETDLGPPIHRAPDAAILEHERKRKVEVKCFELQEQLEEDGVDEDEILTRVGELRTKLTAQAASSSGPRSRATDSHGIALAKQEEMERLRAAFGVSSQYKEGTAFIRETDEEKAQRYAERQEKDLRKAQEIVARELEAEKREKEQQEKDKLRRREEYYRKQQGASNPPPPPSAALPPKPPRESWSDRKRHDDSPRGRSRSRSPLPYDGRAASPPPKRRRSPSDSRSRSPSPKRRARSPSDSRSRSPVRGADSRSPVRRRVDSRSPVRRRTSPSDSRSRSPVRRADSRTPVRRRVDSRSPVRRRRSPSDSRSRSRSRSDSRSPPPTRARRRSSTPPPRRR